MTSYPSHAVCARTVVQRGRQGALATLSTRQEGYPFASLVEYFTEADGAPIFFMSDLATHTRNARQDARASLLITDTLRPGASLAEARVTLTGRLTQLDAARRPALAAQLLARHPDAARFIDFADFHYFKLEPEELRFIAGFGRMGWVEAADYQAAAPDPLAEAAAGILEHMNADHGDALQIYCRAFGGMAEVEEVAMVGVDALGFDVLARAKGEEARRLRWGFDPPALDAMAVRRALVAQVRQGRERLSEG